MWLLEYVNEGHTVEDEKDCKDLTIRMTQFFDDYLKRAPAPLWMLDGIALKDKGYTVGLELDTLGKTPSNGLVSDEDKKRSIIILKYRLLKS